MNNEHLFTEMFIQATQIQEGPYPYQIRFACEEEFPSLIHIPTGLGKTAGVVLSWLWRRRFAEPAIRNNTPRRLVYCLPMRVLVEQTYEHSVRWLENVGLLAGQAQWMDSLSKKHLQQYSLNMEAEVSGWAASQGLSAPAIPVFLLMGGEAVQDWDCYPEREAILIGTQDMLLSRALNRGYTMSRFRWPMHFGLLNNDCLWVFDEIQLMGSGLATTAQLEGFRQAFWPPAKACHSVWMSATLDRRWLKTVDFDPASLRTLKLEKNDHQIEGIQRRFKADKPMEKAKHTMADPKKGLAEEVQQAHRPSSRTLVVLNTVRGVRELYKDLKLLFKKAKGETELVLIHSRFRPPDRQRAVQRLLADPGSGGTIIVSTQVIEAGVDISATTLFTELAPWASLVQRFGRCNRAGKEQDARVLWIDLPSEGKKRKQAALPYRLEDLEVAAEHLQRCCKAGSADLPDIPLEHEHGHVLRTKDLLELFDTTPDLAGNDIDIDRFVREVEESDLQVFWRNWEVNQPPSPDMPRPRREEICPVSVGEFRDFLKSLAKKNRRASKAYRWDFLEGIWTPASEAQVYPGQLYLLHTSAGGYTPTEGWNPKSTEPVPLISLPVDDQRPEANQDDPESQLDRWQSIAEHTNEVCQQLTAILNELQDDDESTKDDVALYLAARWHDRGKAHPAFVAKLKSEALQTSEAQHILSHPHGRIGKAPRGFWRERLAPNAVWGANDGRRRHFRHELASAIAVLMASDEIVPAEIRDLVAYLVAAHHGKVRLSIRSLPNEFRPPESCRRFARGLWDGDVLPATDLGSVTAPEVVLSLELMELGLCQSPPFSGQPSWAERMLRLRDSFGPFRLAFLEALLRAADIRASRLTHSSNSVQKEADHA